MPAIHQQGRTAIRTAISGIVSHVGIATDATAYNTSQTALDPANGGASNLLIKAASISVVDGNTFDATMTVTGDTEFTNKQIFTIGAMNGSGRTNNLSRTVRGLSIGVEAGDNFVIGVRLTVSDETA